MKKNDVSEPKSILKYIGYCRVSDIKQKEEGHSIDAQKNVITKYAKDKGYELIKIYTEQVSGTTACSERNEFKKVIEDLKNGVANGLIVTKFDRLSRNLKDIVCIIDEYFKKNKYKLHFTDFDHIDLSSPEGMFQLNLFSSFAELECSMISKRTKNVLDFKKQKCEKVGGFIPWGFKVEEVKEGNKLIKKLVPNKSEIDLIDELKRLRKKGKTLQELCNYLIEKGIKNRNGALKWQPIQISKIIN